MNKDKKAVSNMTEKNGFERRKEQKMKDIQAATLDLLNSKEVSEITMNLIAESAGVGKVTLFNYYTSKENLFNTCILDFFADVQAYYEQIIDSPMSFEETYKSLSNFEINKINGMNPIFFTNIMTIYKSDHSFFKAFDADQIYLRLFQKGRKEGKINPAYDDQLLLSVMHIYAEGMKALNWKEIELDKYADQLTQIFMNGVR